LLRRAKSSPEGLYFILTASYAFAYSAVVTVSLLYQAQVARLDPLQLMLVGAGMQLATFTFEIPTGVFADVNGRRLSVIMGMTLLAFSFVLLGSTDDFLPILASQVVLGIGLTFTSGAQEAWIADEVGLERASRIYLRSAQVSQVARLAATPTAVGLGLIDLALPLLLAGLMTAVLAAFLVVAMPERGFQPRNLPDTNVRSRLRETLTDGSKLVRRTPILLLFFAMGAFYETAGEVFLRLSVPHFLDNVGLPTIGNFEAVVWFGAIRMASSLASIFLIQLARVNLDMANHRVIGAWLLRINVLQGASIAVFALSQDFVLAFGVYLLATSLSRMFEPLYLAMVNLHIDSSVRATVLSMSSQVEALGQAAGAPVLGLLGSLVSIRAALLGAALTLVPAVGLNLRANAQPLREPARSNQG
jgi:DHA3 family tetracycline resistance protein-like MFS transporter